MSENETKQPSASEVLTLLNEYEAVCASITRLENQTAQLGTPPGAMYTVKLERREAIRQHLRALAAPQPTPEREALERLRQEIEWTFKDAENAARDLNRRSMKVLEGVWAIRRAFDALIAPIKAGEAQ